MKDEFDMDRYMNETFDAGCSSLDTDKEIDMDDEAYEYDEDSEKDDFEDVEDEEDTEEEVEDEADDEEDVQKETEDVEKTPRRGTRAILRQVFASGGNYTLAELAEKVGKSEPSVQVMMSQLKSDKHCGAGGPLNIVRTITYTLGKEG